MEAWWIPALVAVGFVAGALNTVAGGGSFLTLPILIFFGIPPGVANGTNRIGVVLQNVAAVARFERGGLTDRRSLLWAALPATIGSGVGTWLALVTPDQAFRRWLAFFMVVFTLASFWNPRSNPDREAPSRHRWPTFLAFFLVGVYGGFLQAGIGFLFLAVTSTVGVDLVRGNAVKVLAILCLTLFSLALFVWQGQVLWGVGLTLGAGMAAGGWYGARLTLQKGHRWVRAVVTATVVVFAVLLVVLD